LATSELLMRAQCDYVPCPRADVYDSRQLEAAKVKQREIVKARLKLLDDNIKLRQRRWRRPIKTKHTPRGEEQKLAQPAQQAQKEQQQKQAQKEQQQKQAQQQQQEEQQQQQAQQQQQQRQPQQPQQLWPRPKRTGPCPRSPISKPLLLESPSCPSLPPIFLRRQKQQFSGTL
jgi:hypothetical protein